jgi:hypothetical protein
MAAFLEIVERWMTEYGAHERNRTFDLLLTKEVLYRLSYVSVLCCWNLKLETGLPTHYSLLEREKGIEPS